MSRNAAWLWDLVFTRHPDIPQCPSDLPHPWWIDLLFGPYVCQVAIFRTLDSPDLRSRCLRIVTARRYLQTGGSEDGYAAVNVITGGNDLLPNWKSSDPTERNRGCKTLGLPLPLGPFQTSVRDMPGG